MNSLKKSALLGAAMLSLGAVSAANAADLVDTAKAAGNFTTLVAAVEAAGLVETLVGPGPYTIFAPSDEAFALVPAETLTMLLLPENQMQLSNLLLAHVVPGLVSSSDMQKGIHSGSWPNVADIDIKVENMMVVSHTASTATDIYVREVGSDLYVSGNSGQVNEAMIIGRDIEADNGIIHVIDHVLLPAS